MFFSLRDPDTSGTPSRRPAHLSLSVHRTRGYGRQSGRDGRAGEGLDGDHGEADQPHGWVSGPSHAAPDNGPLARRVEEVKKNWAVALLRTRGRQRPRQR